MNGRPTFDRAAAVAELRRARQDFHALLDEATSADLERPTDGTRWTNEEMLFHMMFGYMVVGRLQFLVRVFSRLPEGASRRFSSVLDAGKRPFDVVNYYGSCGGALVFNSRRMGGKFDRVIARLARRIGSASDSDLARGMSFPTSWDPFFEPWMTSGNIYHFATQHFDFHARQLTLTSRRSAGRTGEDADPRLLGAPHPGGR